MLRPSPTSISSVLFDREPQPWDWWPWTGCRSNQNDSLEGVGGLADTCRIAAGCASGIYRDRSCRKATNGLLVTRTVDTGPGGENDPNRMLAKIVASAKAPDSRSKLQSSPEPLPPPAKHGSATVPPVRVRHLYFSEKLVDPNDPTSAVEFYLTVDGEEPKMFDMSSDIPNIVAQQGTVEDWIIENRSQRTARFPYSSTAFSTARIYGQACQ